MPKFLYTVILLACGLWYWFYGIITQTSPDSTTQIVKFLVVTGFALTFTLSIPIYFLIRRKNPEFSNIRFQYRKALKWAGVISSGVIAYLALRAFDVATIINTLLLLVFYAMILLQLRGRR
jgi:hypothetical protein